VQNLEQIQRLHKRKGRYLSEIEASKYFITNLRSRRIDI
jgi:hypothetical protein